MPNQSDRKKELQRRLSKLDSEINRHLDRVEDLKRSRRPLQAELWRLDGEGVDAGDSVHVPADLIAQRKELKKILMFFTGTKPVHGKHWTPLQVCLSKIQGLIGEARRTNDFDGERELLTRVSSALFGILEDTEKSLNQLLCDLGLK